jgi:hypothetical protein
MIKLGWHSLILKEKTLTVMIQSFEPIISKIQILILGTIPGITSLNNQEYYGI